MAYDKVLNEIVVFGGASGTPSLPTLRDTWVYDVAGTNAGHWTNKTVSSPPCSRHSTRMVYDEANSQIVMFGGDAGTDCTTAVNGVLGDIWTWNGTASAWTQQCALGCTPAPSERASEDLSWDGYHNYVLMFGGRGNCSTSPCGDTWSWSGSVWTQQCLTCSPNPPNPSEPSARSTSAIAYSSARDGGRVIMHGGDDGTGIVDGTWEWPAPMTATWTGPISGILSPSPREGHRMAYDVAASQLVMFGGCTGGCNRLDGDFVTPTVNETWLLGATGSWMQMTGIPTGLKARCCVGIAYATASPFAALNFIPGVFLFGGEDSGNVKLGDTWFWYYDTAAHWCQVKSNVTCST